MDDFDGVKTFERGLIAVIVIVFTFILAFVLGVQYGINNTRPVEEIIKVDSLIKVNDSIKIKVEQLDSIKDAKIIEVQTLDNDSTVKLFYELISE